MTQYSREQMREYMREYRQGVRRGALHNTYPKPASNIVAAFSKFGVRQMNWFAYQKSPSGRVPVLFEEYPDKDWDQCANVIFETVVSIPDYLKRASIQEIEHELTRSIEGFLRDTI